MAWVDFYMQTTGSNVNAGSTNTDAATNTYASGTLATVTTTVTFTVASGNPVTDGVVAGDWVSIFPDGSGTTPFISQVTSVTSTTIVCSSTANSFGTVPTNGTSNRTLKKGGAWADMTLTNSGGALASGTTPISLRINMKAGTYANTSSTISLSLVGTTLLPIWWRGYKTTPGDQDNNANPVAGTDVPAITFTTGLLSVPGNWHILSNLSITGASTSASGQVIANGSNAIFYRSYIENTAANGNSSALRLNGAASTAILCYIKATTTATLCTRLGAVGVLDGCTITGGIVGASIGASGSSVLFCVFDSQAGDAVIVGSGQGTYMINCSVYAPGGNGIEFVSPPSGNVSCVANCYFENVNQAGKAAIANTSGTDSRAIIAVGNAYFNCTANTSGITNNFLILTNGTLASAGFANPTAHNFAMNAIGASIAYPGQFQAVTAYQGYFDIGAVQRQPASGSNIIFNPPLSGGMAQ